MAQVMRSSGSSILALVFAATALCVVFATRGAMAGNRIVIEVLHFVGAEDSYIAREFQRHFLLLGLSGGLVGAAAAASALPAPQLRHRHRPWRRAETRPVSALFGRFAVGPIGISARSASPS